MRLPSLSFTHATTLRPRATTVRRPTTRCDSSSSESIVTACSPGPKTDLPRIRTVGAVVFYPMKDVRPELYAIYEARVEEGLRGKSLGKRLLAVSLARMRARGAQSCEVLTIPDISPAAHKVYTGAGFQRVTSWAIY